MAFGFSAFDFRLSAFVGLALVVVPARTVAATTKYWITRAVTCHTWTQAGAQAELNTARDALKARTDGWTAGFCDVKLPEGATIRWGRAYGSDTSLQAMSFAVRRATFCSEAYSDIVAWSSTDNAADPVCTAAGWTNAVQLNEVVNNSQYTYWFYFMIPYSLEPDALRLWNLEIEYQVP